MTDKRNPPIALEDRAQDGAKLRSPSAERNRRVIAEQLSTLLPHGASVLEIASGTGEHALTMCRARHDITWQPSDPNPASRASQNAWASDVDGQMLPSLDIDTTQVDWAVRLPQYDVIFCANMIHIAPWEAALGLAVASAELVKTDGMVVLYGPFKEGQDTAQSNLDFDISLKSRDPRWGVRNLSDVKHIFAKAGFNRCDRIVMPKNNQILVFQRS
ncbi:DUF938 domain-containing protein [Fretibacter rubidus]|uniref:DUF938 domain-containing protein n=1 Tax=Fretibacter rubidus TaxID=570162 RepID=UPI00352A5A9A